MANSDTARSETTVFSGGPMRPLYLVYRSSGSTSADVEEVVFNCQGYVVESHLPPILNKSQPLLGFQDITITGLGCHQFDTFVQAVDVVRTMFDRSSSGRGVSQRQKISSDIGSTLRFSNRYFTQLDEAGNSVTIPFSEDVDPLGILKEIKGGLHTSENEVAYFERVDVNGTLVKPEEIVAGLLVEIQCTFFAVPSKAKEYRFISKLRSICILDRTVEKASIPTLRDATILSMEQVKASTSRRTIKRKVGYGVEDDEPETSEVKRMRRLSLSDKVQVSMVE
ncbi:hypothetical protein QCA50_009481 [Cerrena zonata]